MPLDSDVIKIRTKQFRYSANELTLETYTS